MTIHVIALAALGQGLSGGDRIFIEFSRRWAKQSPVSLYVWEEGQQMCLRENLTDKDVAIKLIKVGSIAKLGFVITYLYRILLGLKLGLTLRLEPNSIIYSASEFWMDSLPAWLLKLRYPHAIWAAAWYQTAPNPLTGFFGGRYRLHAFAYWLAQLPIKPLISRWANAVLINNESERKQFAHFPNLKQIVVIGAVDTNRINTYIKNHKSPQTKKYLAVFQGRFHPQKGVGELVGIWKKVVTQLPSAKLAMIGDGPLKATVLKKIAENHLTNTIDLYGFISDGDKKYEIFNQSKIVVHPALYDSGGMASAEAMAFGLPCVGFDLPAYASYYPQGMIKVPMNNLDEFAQKIIFLSKAKDVYAKYAGQAKKLISTNWSWDKRAEDTLTSILKS